MTQAIIDQKDIQKSGGICVRYPVSCLIRNLLVKAKLLHPFKTLMVLDLTYGRGTFWAALPQAKVFAFDIRKLDWVRKPHQFFNESCRNWKKRLPDHKFDLICADPPFSPYHIGNNDVRKYYNERDVALILYEAIKAAEHYQAPLLLHFLAKLQYHNTVVIAETWFQGRSRYARMPRPTWFGVLRVVSDKKGF